MEATCRQGLAQTRAGTRQPYVLQHGLSVLSLRASPSQMTGDTMLELKEQFPFCKMQALLFTCCCHRAFCKERFALCRWLLHALTLHPQQRHPSLKSAFSFSEISLATSRARCLLGSVPAVVSRRCYLAALMGFGEMWGWSVSPWRWQPILTTLMDQKGAGTS